MKNNKIKSGKKSKTAGYKIGDSFKDLEATKKIEMLKKMYEIRHFEDEVDRLSKNGEIHGAAHLYIGEEATAVGAISAINKKDFITSTHRGHGHCIAKGAMLNLMLAEILGKKTGYCKGKGGSMHIIDIDTGNLGTNGIVGGGIGIATGASFTCKMKEKGKIVLCFFGDGAINRGIFHSCLNMASVWNLPIIYICENNIYGLSTPIKEVININQISDRKCAYGIDGMTIDGNNAVDVFNTIKFFADRCRKGKGPVFIECLTYRWKGHSAADIDTQVYRTKEETKNWMKKDPIKRYKKILVKKGVLTEKEIIDLEEGVIAELKKAVRFAKESPFPNQAEVGEDIYA